MSNRNHPLRQLLDYAAAGQTPSAKELDEIASRSGDYPGATLRREIKDAIEKVVGVRRGGENGRARRMAREFAQDIIAKVGNLEPVERDLPDDDPQKLAARVRGDDPDDPESPRILAAQIDRY